MPLTKEEWAEIPRPWLVIERCMERGNLVTARFLLGDAGLREIVEARHPEPAQFLASARDWIAEAQAHEAEHGEGSRMVPDHPSNIEAARRRRLNEEQARWDALARSRTDGAARTGRRVPGLELAQEVRSDRQGFLKAVRDPGFEPGASDLVEVDRPFPNG